MIEENKDKLELENAPPFLSKWSNLYWLVFFSLVTWLVIFYIFRRIFE